MQRRKLLAAMGSLAAGTAAATGTGAFTSVSADRSVSVDVTGDSSALLSLSAAGSANGEYAETTDDGQVKIDLSNAMGSGVNDDAKTTILDILNIQNKGTQPVAVYVPPGSVSPDRVGAEDGTYDGFYIDPQFSSQPNGSYDGAFSATVVYYLSGGEPNFVHAANRAFSDTGGVKNYILGAGQSLNFGLFIEADKNGTEGEFDGDVSLDIRADATVVPDDFTTS